MVYPSDPRVLFAAERTLLAWQRSAIALLGFGFVVERFGLFLQMVLHAPLHGAQRDFSLTLGVILLLLGAGRGAGFGAPISADPKKHRARRRAARLLGQRRGRPQCSYRINRRSPRHSLPMADLRAACRESPTILTLRNVFAYRRKDGCRPTLQPAL